MTRILILDGGLGTSLEQKYGCQFSSQHTPLWSSDLLVSDPATLRRCQADFGRVPVDVVLTATYQVSVEGFAATKRRRRRRVVTGAAAAAAAGSSRLEEEEGGEEEEEQGGGIPRALIPRYLDDAVRIAHEAATAADGGSSSSSSNATQLALSIGPYGACMVPSQEYSGRYDAAHATEDALAAWHKDRMRLFAAVPGIRTRVGLVALETIPRADEIVAMRRALAAVPALSSLPFWMSCVFPDDDNSNDNEDEDGMLNLRLPDGSSVEAALSGMLNPVAAAAASATTRGDAAAAGLPACWGVGINCTKIARLPALVARYEDAVARMLRRGEIGAWPEALVLYPDGTNGEVYDTATQRWEMPAAAVGGARREEVVVSWARQLADVVRAAQARGRWKQIVVGGCCMASAEDIAALRAELL